MSFLTILYNTFTPIFLIVGAVIVVGRYVPLDARVFSRAIIYLFTPALVLNSIATTELSANEMGRVILATIGCGLVMAGLAWGVARLMGFSRQFTGTFLATAIIMNGLNFGIPFIRFAFGDHAYDRAVLFNVGQIFVVYTLGIYVISRGTGSVRDSLGNIFRIPLPYAFTLGIVVNLLGWELPLPIGRAVATLAEATVPCALVILGLQLSHAQLRGQWRPLFTISAVRFIGGALIATLLTMATGLSGLTQQVFIVQYSMPVGVSSGVLAVEFGGDGPFAAAAVMFTTLISIIPLSLLLLIV
jgi:malate permease and related proteins